MTVKQVIVGTLVGSSVLGLMARRIQTAWTLQQKTNATVSAKATHHVVKSQKTVSSLKKSPSLSKKHSRTELSSRKLYNQ